MPLPIDDRGALACPICGQNNTHLTAGGTHMGGTPGERLDAELEFRCENGHQFILTVHQHKGETTIGWGEL